MFDLRQWAKENRVTQKQIARMSGTSTQPISSLMNGGHCLEETIIKVCAGIGQTYRREAWESYILKIEPPQRLKRREIEMDYDQIRNYRDRRSMEESKRNLTIGETVKVAFSGSKKIRWERGELVRIYDGHAGVNVRLKTKSGKLLVIRKSFRVDDLVKWKRGA